MVSKANEDLPEPLRPVITVRLSRAISTLTPLRLCSRAPRTLMCVSISSASFRFCSSGIRRWPSPSTPPSAIWARLSEMPAVTASDHPAEGWGAGGRADVGLGVRGLPVAHEAEALRERREARVAKRATHAWVPEQ